MHTEIFITAAILGIILFLVLISLVIYSLIEFIQVSHLAKEALNIYIDNNENKVR